MPQIISKIQRRSSSRGLTVKYVYVPCTWSEEIFILLRDDQSAVVGDYINKMKMTFDLNFAY